MVKKADVRLAEAAATYKQRNAIYKDTYKQHGKVMKALFPQGIGLDSVADQNRYQIFNTMVSKMVRYANNFRTGGHQDSIHDICVYAAMLDEVDEEAAITAGEDFANHQEQE